MRRICVMAVATFVALGGCVSGTATPSSVGVAATVAPAPTVAASLAAATATSKPTATPLPTAIPRRLDFPTDGTCEPDHTCLGVLEPGAHHSEVFTPGLAFTTAHAGWENLEQAGGAFDLTSITAPGDAITFFRGARAANRDGSPATSVEGSVAGLEAWLATNPALVTTVATPITIGGLKGQWSDVTISPNATDRGPDCPTTACVQFLHGRDPSSKPTWVWEAGVASSERARLYLLDWKEDVVAILVDSLDGTTFDALTKEADAILASVAFDKD